MNRQNNTTLIKMELNDPMRNCAEKDAIKWCHLTHQFIAVGGGGKVNPYQFIAVNPN